MVFYTFYWYYYYSTLIFVRYIWSSRTHDNVFSGAMKLQIVKRGVVGLTAGVSPRPQSPAASLQSL